MALEIPTKPTRHFLPESFEVTTWEELEPYFNELLSRDILSAEDLKKWFLDESELGSVLSEDLAWRYIRMTCDTTDEDSQKAYQFFITEIQPKAAPYSDKLNRKALESEFLSEMSDPAYQIMIRSMKKDVEIFREENIPIQTEIQQEAQRFGQISGAMSIELDGNELTLQQAAVHLQSPDRAQRERVYHKISSRRLEDKDQLDKLFTNLVTLRDKVGANAGFPNFRDYKFSSLGRFDYTVQDCFDFHESIESAVVPLLDGLAEERKTALGVDILRPWDKAVDPQNRPALKPFDSGEQLLDRSIKVFGKLDNYLGDRLKIMDNMGHLDLESKKGKAPGGYNYPLAEIGVPFIFMNATSTLRDMVTLMHEGGHAVHSFLTRDLELGAFKHTPSEVAELASMAMELLSMDHWDHFFESEADLRRAKIEHLEQIIETLPWVATIDKFQHWIYENPGHTEAERKEEWNSIFNKFSDRITEWSGLEQQRDYMWHRQLHLFEVPFYYIEYGMAQLGAIAVWKNFRENRQKGLDDYLKALKLGYTRTIPEIYSAAGIEFSFTKDYVEDLIGFVKQELDDLKKSDN